MKKLTMPLKLKVRTSILILDKFSFRRRYIINNLQRESIDIEELLYHKDIRILNIEKSQTSDVYFIKLAKICQKMKK